MGNKQRGRERVHATKREREQGERGREKTGSERERESENVRRRRTREEVRERDDELRREETLREPATTYRMVSWSAPCTTATNVLRIPITWDSLDSSP